MKDSDKSNVSIRKKLISVTPLGRWGIMFACIVIVVLLVRHFCIGSYRISTHSMEEALHKGDLILVNKWNSKNNLKRNQVILFTSPLQKDKGKAPLIVSRCVALPGDTIEVSNDGYRINGTLFPLSPYSLASYTIPKELREPFLNLLTKLNIPHRELKEKNIRLALHLTTFEEYQIREELNNRINQLFVREKEESYSLVVPRKGETYELTESFLTASREAIAAEAKGTVSFRNRKLFVDGKETGRFQFSRDYYWVLSDNTEDAVDSRHVGFIPSDHIVGNAWFCWYSKDKQHHFKKIN